MSDFLERTCPIRQSAPKNGAAPLSPESAFSRLGTFWSFWDMMDIDGPRLIAAIKRMTARRDWCRFNVENLRKEDPSEIHFFAPKGEGKDKALEDNEFIRGLAEKLKLKTTVAHLDMCSNLWRSSRVKTEILGNCHEQVLFNFEIEVDGLGVMMFSEQSNDVLKSVKAIPQEVFEAFPKVDFDLEEAAKCFALARFTASVFHYMRSMELVAREAARHLVGGERDVNQTALANIPDLIDAAARRIKECGKESTTRSNYWHSVASHLRSATKGWRNQVAHPGQVYTEEQANEIRTATIALIREVAVLKKSENF